MTEWEKEKRKQKRLEQLGSIEPRCGCCPEGDYRCLELHHSAGAKFDDTTVILCRNCHRKTSDDQKNHPDPLAGEPTLIERVAHLLLGMADLFGLLAEQCRKFAKLILAQLSSVGGASA